MQMIRYAYHPTKQVTLTFDKVRLNQEALQKLEEIVEHLGDEEKAKGLASEFL